jgi:hypothetical protein
MRTIEALKLVDAVQGTRLAIVRRGIKLPQDREPFQRSTVPLWLIEIEAMKRAHLQEASIDG